MTNCNTTQPFICPPTTNYSSCKPWDLTQQGKTNCLTDSYIQETLSIAGAQVNVYKLLGVYEQTLLLDLTGNGSAISGGDAPNFPASNAFTKITTEWHSSQSGSALLASGYIGYDFGIIRLPNGRQQYGIPTSIRQHITTIKIKQSNDPSSRVTKARVERSDDGKNWYGVSVITLPNDNNLNTISFKESVPSRFWRLRPITLTGTDCNYWGIQALELHDYSATQLSNIEDKVFLENRDRNYSQEPVLLKGFYELIQLNTDLSRFGIDLSTAAISYQIRINFTNCVATLGRPIVIGDIVELPSETQYTPSLTPVKRYLEVTDVTWDPSSFTPGWLPTMLLISAQPAIATQETQDIFGPLSAQIDSSGLFNNNDGSNSVYQDISNIDQTIKAEGLNAVPERGSEGSNVVREFTDEEKTAANYVGLEVGRIGFNRVGLYVEDAIPQNNAPYTEGDTFPLKPKDGDYHRMTYTGLAENVPARLYRWSTKKDRWIYLETDKRQRYNMEKELLDEYATSKYRVPSQEI